MEIIKTQNIGFCNGVNHTINKAYELLKKNNNLYCLGELIHNEIVINDLKNKGLKIINNIEEAENNSTVIFRAHGEPNTTYEKAKEKKINIIDLTCSKIKIIHNKIIKNENNSIIIIVGKKKHPETIGSFGHTNNESLIIENIDDIENSINIINKSKLKKIYICVQTTFSKEKFNQITTILKQKIKNKEITIDNTICNATTNRQNEIEKISKEVELLIVIGGKNSSNTKELYNISKTNCEKTYIIQEKKDLKNINFNNIKKLAITSGASTPLSLINEIEKEIKKINNC